MKNDFYFKNINIPQRPKLSERDSKVLKYIAMGHDRYEIGDIMGLRYKQVDWTFGKLRDKFNARTSAQVVHLAHVYGYLKVRG